MLGRNEKLPQTKLTAVQYITLVVFLVLSYGLWSLQIRKSDEYEVRAQQNRVRSVPILAPRGKILDREGRLIVDNYPSFSALLLRDQMRDLYADAEKIADGLHIPVEDIRGQIREFQLKRKPAFEPIIIKDDITPDERAFIESHRDEFPELEIMMVHRRLYPPNGFMAHLIGYVGQVSQDMLSRPEYDLYEKGDIVGQSGIEAYYNDLLMGKNGSRRVLVDSKGKEVGRQSTEPAVIGKPLKLTIDLDVQIAAEQALEGRNGAVVAMDPRTGEILAMVSRPIFDPNDFAVRISRDEWDRLRNDVAHPLMNKAIQAQLAPGSTFKIIMATAGLQEGIAQKLHVNCPGGGTFYGHFYKCWISEKHLTHGAVEISKGIYQSCDTFFYTLAERLGIQKIAKWAMMLGLGNRTGIDLPGEVTGVMPSEEWKARVFHQKWYAGEVISVGIGQGAVAVTPIQLAHAIAAITTGGTLVRPHVVNLEDLPPEYRSASATNSPTVTHVGIDPQNWITITDAMAGVVSPVGTAGAAHLQGVDFAGKTGSAQVVSNTFRKTKAGASSIYKDNGWFVGVTPRRNPEIVVALLIEQGEHGPIAAQLASKVIKAFVEKQRRVHNNPMLFSDKADPGSVPMAAVWNNSGAEDQQNQVEAQNAGEDRLEGGTMMIKMGKNVHRHSKRQATGLAAILPGGQ
ncbi:MAG TPA: penicillin-binding protein 2 [Candidatus Angelobacter sp.]|nr:penicillin-binding protein 2 [Candidatus Angelobacter sp.]